MDIKELLEQYDKIDEKLIGAKVLENDAIAKAYILSFTTSNDNKYVTALVYDGTDAYIGRVTFSPFTAETRWEFCDKEDYKVEFADVDLKAVEEEIRSQIMDSENEYKPYIYADSKIDAWNKFVSEV